MPKQTKDKFYNFISTLKPSERSLSLYIRLFVLAVVALLSKQYETLLTDNIFMANISILVIVYLTLGFFFHISSAFTIFLYKKKNRLKEGTDDNFTIGIKKLSRFVFMFIFVLFFINTVIMNLQELVASLAIATFLIGLTFKDYILNFLNGIDIMFSGKIKLGEYIKIDKYKGRVKDLTFSQIELVSELGNVIYLPNNFVKTKHIINYTRSRVRNVIVEIILDKSRFVYFKQLRAHIIKQVVKDKSDILCGENKINIIFQNVEKETIKLRVEYIIPRYNFDIDKLLRNYTSEIVVEFYNKKDKQKAKLEQKSKEK